LVSKNAEFYADFKFVDADLKQMPLKKLEPKTMQVLSIFVFVHFFMVLLLTFVRGISEGRHQQI
jgi:hypothetical protein